MEDRAILALFLSRSDRAVDALAQAYGPLCRSIALGVLGDPRDAEECENDAYLQVWNAIPPARPDHLRAYVCRTVRNLALNRLRRDARQKRGGGPETLYTELSDAIPSGDDVAAAADDTVLQCLRTFLAGQSRRDRALFLRRYFYAQPVKELAPLFHMTESAVSTRLGRMRAKLKDYFIQEGITL